MRSTVTSKHCRKGPARGRCCLANRLSRCAAECRVTTPYLSDSVASLNGKIGDGLVAHRSAGRQHQAQRFGIEIDVDRGDFFSFAENFVHHRYQQGYGPIRVKQELQQRGVASDIIEEYLCQDIDWYQGLVSQWQKRFGDKPQDFKEQAKQMRYLQYRGFDNDLIKTLFSEL